VERCGANGTQLVLTDLQFQPLKTLARAGVAPIEGVLWFAPTLGEALQSLSAQQVAAPA